MSSFQFSSGFIFFLSFITILFGCGCAPGTMQETFCQADWVSHVRVLAQQPSTNPLQSAFTVQHIQIFKSPGGMMTLPQFVTTPINSAACGLPIMAGKDYLLSGTLQNNALSSFSCGQLRPDNLIDPSMTVGLLPEWQQLPIGFVESLQVMQC
ncbi:unnamed protein product, partial [Mesorhabditis belari]|uniref:NTR domain-containing protein n=1 Tax=Mesorhabditis belari TaxID=2138241 RepID=A0AAF3ELM2_9BILA